MAVSQAHRDYLRAQAISDTFVDAVCDSEPDGMVFNFVGPTGRTARQKRLDSPPDADSRFMGPAGVPSVMPVPPGHQELVVNATIPLVVVEGSKGILAAASALEGSTQPPLALVGVLGCWGWSSDGRPTEDLMGIPCTGRDVVIMFDADWTVNRHVWDAAKALSEHLLVVKGAALVRFAMIPGRDKDGLDDLLSSVEPPDREGVLRRLVNAAGSSLGRRPARPRTKRPACFDADGNFLAMTCFRMLEERHPMACTQENTVAVFSGGKYHSGESKHFNASVVALLGEYFRDTYLRTVHELAVSLLRTTGRVIPVRPDRLLVNVRNGLLDPVTLTLLPHDPGFLALFQFDVEWDPTASCPVYEKWIEQVLPGRAEELEDAIAPMLNPLVTPSKAVFLYGPSKSGKSTYGRLLAAVVGKESTSSVTLHQLSDDRFAAANLYGKALNLSMDLPSRDVRDLSLFKMITGDDPVQANRKYGSQFSFTSTALTMFSANEVPAVSETSKAWTARVAPFSFANSFIGAEDPGIEEAMMRELPGIFRRWVIALQKHLARGGYIDTTGHADAQEFQRKTNRVSEFLFERTQPSENPVGTLRPALYAEYKVWTEANGGAPLGRNRFFDSVRTLDVGEFKPERGSWHFAVTLRDPEKSSAVSAVLPNPTTGEDSPRCDQQSTPVPGLFKTAETAEPVVFDSEAGSVGCLWTADPGDYIRVIGVETAGGIEVGHDMKVPSDVPLVAHNGFQFDFHALARRGDLDILAAGEAGLLIDTKVLAALDDPPPVDMKPGRIEKHYSLQALTERLGLPGKTDDIRRLARTHNKAAGLPDPFMAIPLDDPEYLSYCRGDVEATRALFDRLPVTDYARREMRLLARLAASVTGVGFRVDLDLIERRNSSGESVISERRAWLTERYGLPTSRKDGSESAKPHSTQEGRAAILAAFKDLGADPDHWPRSMRTANGAPSLSAGSMQVLIDAAGEDLPGAVELASTVQAMQGVRSIYGNIRAHLGSDGRVHPTISARQASGRLSITDPGLTVVGKRDGRWVEREVFLPEEGHLIVPFDLDQVDARAVAGLCQDPAYMALFTDPKIDSHEEIAYRLWGVRDGKKGPYRNKAKRIGHAWNYGAGIARIVRETGIAEADVRRFDEGMRTDFPLLVQWKRDMAETARTGALMDNGFGRMMRPNPDRAHTQGPALMGQGAARDLMMGGILRLPVEVVPMLRAGVHDEVVLSIPKDVVDDVIPVVLGALADDFRGIPITAGCEPPAENWGRCYAPRKTAK